MTRLLVRYCDTVVMFLVVGICTFLCVACTEIGKRLQSAVDISDMDMGEVCGRASVREWKKDIGWGCYGRSEEWSY